MNKYEHLGYEPIKKEKNAFGKFEEEYLAPIEQGLSDYAKAFVRGGTKGIKSMQEGITGLANMVLPESVKNILPEGFIPSAKEYSASLDQNLPLGNTPGAQFAEGVFERAVPTAVIGAATGGTGYLLPSLLSGIAGQTTEELGGGPLAQVLSEIVGYRIPSLTSKAISATSKQLPLSSGKTISQKELVDEARRLGLSEEQITPLIQSERKQKIFSKIASKGEKTQEALQSTKSGISGIYDALESSPASKNLISEKVGSKLFNDMTKLSSEIDTQAYYSPEFQNSLKRFVNSEGKGSDLIRFHKDITKLYNKHPSLSVFKKPIKQALSSIDSQLGKDYDLANKFMSRYYDIANKLKPGKLEGFLDTTTGKAIGGGIAYMLTHNDPSALTYTLIGLGLTEASRKLFSNMLTKPAYQNLSSKFIDAINQSKPAAAQIISKNFIKEMVKDKIDPELIAILQTLDTDQILSSQENQKIDR